MPQQNYYNDLEKIFWAGVERVDPYKLITNHVFLEQSMLRIATDDFQRSIDLDDFEKIYVIGAGKATAKMARAIEDILGSRITTGIISVKYGHTDHLKNIEMIEAGHPIPDENGIYAARKIADLARSADAKTLIITLISGGGSALTPCPYSYEAGDERRVLSLKEKQETTQILLECGATINEVNCIRKHLSNIKGGRLAQMIFPAVSLNFILSDVVGDRLDTIASGLTTHDRSTFEELQAIVEKYGLAEKLPGNVQNIIALGSAGRLPETPKSGDAVFEKVNNILIGSNILCLKAAQKKALALGYDSVILSSQITGEAKEVARVLCGIARDVKKYGLLAGTPACIITGGETTVTLRGTGQGGRNQEVALAFLAEIEIYPQETEGVFFLCASTDGNDGPTDAAGAFASNEVLNRSQKARLSINDHLKNNDSYPFFDQIGGLLKTGPTNTNVCDMQIMIIS
jgi:glycerate 2-kinase